MALTIPREDVDYSLVGVNAERAVEQGLAEADWYTTPVPRAEMRKLLEREDGPAIRDTAIWFGLMFLFGGLAASVTSYVAGGNANEVRLDIEVLERLNDSGCAEEVHLNSKVDRCIEADRGSAVYHSVARRYERPTSVVESEAVGADVACDHVHPLIDLLPERLGSGLAVTISQFGHPTVEDVVAEDFSTGSVSDGAAFAGADQKHEFTVGNAAHQALHQCRAEKAGCARDGDSLPGQLLRN